MSHVSLCCGCVCYVECTQNWLLHAIELCILTFFKGTKKGSKNTWKCEWTTSTLSTSPKTVGGAKIGWSKKQLADFHGSKWLTPFTNPFSSVPNDISFEITIKSDRDGRNDLVTDVLGAPSNSLTTKFRKLTEIHPFSDENDDLFSSDTYGGVHKIRHSPCKRFFHSFSYKKNDIMLISYF